MLKRILVTFILLFLITDVAFSGDGDFDSTFDGDGVAIYEGGDRFSSTAGYSGALQEDGKIIVAGSINGDLSIVRFNDNGLLDISFDGDGIATSMYVGRGSGVTIQPDGKIVVAGQGDNDAVLLRYNSDGTPDTSFGGGDGIVTYAAGTFTAVILQPDGKMVVVGYSDFPEFETLIMRYNSDGTLDDGFGSNGRAIKKNYEHWEPAAVALQADGKIVVTANYNYGNPFLGVENYPPRGPYDDIVVLRYNSNGKPDTTFGASGVVRYHDPANNVFPSSIAIQADGKIVVAGHRNIATSLLTDITILRFNSNGTLDTTFNGSGIAAYDSGRADYSRDVAIQADGKIVVAGSNMTSKYIDKVLILRYHTDGQIDKMFGYDGAVVYKGSRANGMLIQPNGKIVVTGGATNVQGNGEIITLRLIGQSVRLLSPNGGELLASGSQFDIQWEAATPDITSFRLKYTLNNGTIWKLINSSPITGTNYDWTVPQPLGNRQKCLVKVFAYDINDRNVGADKSDTSFSIEVAKLASPDGGEAFTSGEQHTITWHTNGVPPEAKVALSYTLNDGIVWKPIDTTTDRLNDGVFLWTVPPVSAIKTKCKVKITLKGASGATLGSDTSDAVFTIMPTP
jgi:uncharacterized delta-60 repeat protein